ncbi:cytochrome P450, family 722, subfamily A, polypeptide 1 [Tasmannia lanceolata]|uniref:cytochrome P450, family 722, subfamily A, polypeptide 1 n=1 Tax=Tasmannia lanceolata TaxID=3420 RepID=UPI0040627E2C
MVFVFLFFPLIPLLLVGFLIRKIVKTFSKVRESTAGDPPGSSGFPLIGETLSFLAANNSSRGFYDFVRIRRIRYGNCFKTNIFGNTHVFVSGKESAKAVLGNDFVDFTKRYMKSIAATVGDRSLLCVPHHEHKFIRSRLSTLFTTNSMSSFIKQFDDATLRALDEWEGRENVVVHHEALKITFIAICKMLISLENLEEVEKLQKDVSEVSDAMLAFPLRLPWTRFYKGMKARERIMDTLRKIIALRRKGLEYHEDFLQSLFAEGESPCDATLTDIQIQDNILTLIIAGVDTTASTMTWMVKYLDENQQVQETVRDLHFLLGDKALGSSLKLEDLNKMPYASKVVKESLRMTSLVPWFPRIALKDCELQGFRIRKGWIVNVDARSVHYDPTIYNEPTKFQPSRFDEDPKAYSFLAFGTGARTCLGMNLAKAMMLVFLHRLVTTYRWKVIDTDPSLETWALFPRLKNGCPISVMRIRPN